MAQNVTTREIGVVVVGGRLAGLAAATYVARAGISVTIKVRTVYIVVNPNKRWVLAGQIGPAGGLGVLDARA